MKISKITVILSSLVIISMTSSATGSPHLPGAPIMTANGSEWKQLTWNIPSLGANLPLIGDRSKAYHYDNLGKSAIANGAWHEAKSDFEMAASATLSGDDPVAQLGLARCAAQEGDYIEAIAKYKTVINLNTYSIDLLTEYVLTLLKAGNTPDAIVYYNHAVDILHGWSGLGIYPNKFKPDGSDFDPAQMAAVVNAMRAIAPPYGFRDSNTKELEAEIGAAVDLEPKSSIVYFYKGVLLQETNMPGAQEALKKALVLDDGANAKVINKWLANTNN